MHGGATWALNQLVASTPMAKALHQVFPEHRNALKLLSLAYYLILNADSSLCNYEEFAECTWLPYQRALTSGAVSRLLQKITKDKIFRFLQALNREYGKARTGNVSERKFWALDSTSVTSYSTQISSVDYGHNKDLIEAPQTNVLLVVDQTSGEPVYWRNFDGNVPDVSTIRNTLAEWAASKIDLENVIVVTDRGYASAGNWEDMMRNGVSFISNARRNLNNTITALIDENYAALLDWNNHIDFINQSAVTVPIEWYYDAFPIKDKRRHKQTKKTLYIHLYFCKTINDEATDRLRSALTQTIVQHRTAPNKLTAYQQKMITAYMTEKDGKLEINMAKVDAALRYVGVRVLVSDTVSDALECCTAYEERNQVEYAIAAMKDAMKCNRTRVHSSAAWEAKLFLQMIATTISGMVRSRVRLYNESARRKRGKYRVHYDSDRKLLAKLNNVYMTQLPDGWLFDETAGKKKELFNILGIGAPTAEQIVGLSPDDEDEADRRDVDIAIPDLEQLEEL